MRRLTKVGIELALYLGVIVLALAVGITSQSRTEEGQLDLGAGDSEMTAGRRTNQSVEPEVAAGGSNTEHSEPTGDHERPTPETVRAIAELFPQAPPPPPVVQAPPAPEPEPEPPPDPEPEPELDTEAILRQQAVDAEPEPPPPEPAPWLSYTGMVQRDGYRTHFFKNQRDGSVIGARIGVEIDGVRLAERPDGTFVLTQDGVSYLVGN